MLQLGWAVGGSGREHGSKVLIGKDTRISGYLLESALEAGLVAAGVDIHLLGPMPTGYRLPYPHAACAGGNRDKRLTTIRTTTTASNFL